MEPLHVIALAVVQGLTEFLPVSSSAHLILLPLVVSWPDQGLAFDVAVHVGTLGAVLGYFRADLRRMARDWLRSLASGRAVGDSRLVWYVGAGTVPVGVAGLAVNSLAGDGLRSPLVIALATLGFGLALWWADRAGTGGRDERALTWRDVALIGCAQALALIPGASRSGITMTAGLALGLSRSGAARFSFLLSIPVIALAGGLKLTEAWTSGAPVDWAALAAGTLLAFLCAYLCIHYFLKLLERIGFLPFVIYRLALGAALLVFAV